MESESKIQPIFIFSLPRSGSTLLQRILASHNDITTTAEPWVLLPYLYTLKKSGVYAEYGHHLLADALQDFCAEMPNGIDDYLHELRAFMMNLYSKASQKNTPYFLDKTPRYHLISEEIMHLFPDAKFILLWRNPLAIIASMIETWGDKKWNLFHYKVDLYDGMRNLTDIQTRFSNRLIIIRYEDLLSNSESEVKNICAALNIKYSPALLDSFANVKLKGSYADPTGQKKYNSLSLEPIEKWKETINNPWRKAWCKRYLKWLGYERLERMGYSLDDLLAELETAPIAMKGTFSDLLLAIYGTIYCTVEPNTLRDKIRKLPEWKWIRNHD